MGSLLRNFGLLVLLSVSLPVAARADMFPPNHLHLGGTVQGVFSSQGSGMLLTGIASWAYHENLTVGVEGGASVLGLPMWRAGIVAQAYIGEEFIRPFVQARLEAISVRKVISPAFGMAFGVAWVPIERLAVIPQVGFDGNFNVNGTSVVDAGLSVQFQL